MQEYIYHQILFTTYFIALFIQVCTTYISHLFNKRGGWNKRGGGAKVAKSLNVEAGINVEGGFFGKN